MENYWGSYMLICLRMYLPFLVPHTHVMENDEELIF